MWLPHSVSDWLSMGRTRTHPELSLDFGLCWTQAGSCNGKFSLNPLWSNKEIDTVWAGGDDDVFSLWAVYCCIIRSLKKKKCGVNGLKVCLESCLGGHCAEIQEMQVQVVILPLAYLEVLKNSLNLSCFLTILTRVSYKSNSKFVLNHWDSFQWSISTVLVSGSLCIPSVTIVSLLSWAPKIPIIQMRVMVAAWGLFGGLTALSPMS